MKLVHRFAAAVAACTLILIFAGAMVTSTDSSLSVPDWPLSYGQIMPPMVGGIFYEHGHRMIATLVGFLTIILAFLLAVRTDRKWLKKAGWIALFLVCLQGLLGGITVLLRLPPAISIAHACLSQTFFCLVISIAVWTSAWWSNAVPRVEPAERGVPLHRGALVLFATAWTQLLLGAILRHTGTALPFHIGGAIMLVVLTFWLSSRIFLDHPDQRGLRLLAGSLIGLIILQVSLGISSYFILTHRFDTIPPPLWAPSTVSAHVAMGAVFLGLSTLLALMLYRTRAPHEHPLKTTLNDYITLTKPGISIMAGVTALAGFVLGSGGEVNYPKLFHTCLGTLLAAGGAGTLNMLIERDVDARMGRTSRRPLPSGRLNPGEALLLGVFLSVVSVAYLSWAVNGLTAILAGATVSVYIYIYTPLKKISTLSVTIGAIAGALPPVIGWTAATGSLGIEALALFGILFFWQFPHFFSLAWMYRDDYQKGGLHVIPTEDRAAKVSILLTTLALLAVSLSPTALGLTGRMYFVAAVLAGAVMLYYSLRFFIEPSRRWARNLFFLSLAYIPVLVTMMLLDGPSSLGAGR
jgi:heme o synthase